MPIENHVCPVCRGELTYSSVYSTYAGYIHPLGHHHDDNAVTMLCTCNNGHAIDVFVPAKCPACDWQRTSSMMVRPEAVAGLWMNDLPLKE